MAQAGSSESSNRLRRFRGSKVGQGPLGGSESMSVRSRASLGEERKRNETLDPKADCAQQPEVLGLLTASPWCVPASRGRGSPSDPGQDGLWGERGTTERGQDKQGVEG